MAILVPLGVFDGALVRREYLLGNAFTVADLNVAAILRWARIAGLDFSLVPKVERWLDVCLARPACGCLMRTRHGQSLT